MKGLLLAVDTSTKVASIAIYDGIRVRAETTWEAPRRHTVELTPRVVEMLDELRLAASDLTGVAVALGPGSFTGLRIGLALAKGLALAGSIPLIGVPTLDITVYPIRHRRATLYATLLAGRGRVCVASYRWRRQRWRQTGELHVTTWAALAERIEEGAVVCGELDPAGLKALAGRGAAIHVVSPAQRLRRAGYLAELGWKRLAQGEHDNAATLQPIYLHTV